MSDRGYVRVGQVADLVVFAADELRDRATYQAPFEESVGVRWVFVAGEAAIADGKFLGSLAGQPLRHESIGR